MSEGGRILPVPRLLPNWHVRLAVLLCALAWVVLGVNGEPLRAADAELTPRVFLPLHLEGYTTASPPHSPFGVSDTADVQFAFSPYNAGLALAAGISFNRTSVVWNDIEATNTTPDHFFWGHADLAINRILAEGFQPYVMIFVNPSWAASTPCGPVYDPDEMAEFVGALAAHYPQVPYWGLYNEADNASYSSTNTSTGGCFGEDDIDGNGKPDYADYAELMRAVWSAMHAANPNTKLAFGNLAFDNFTPESFPPDYPGGCCFNYHFLDNLLGYMQAHPLPDGQKYADVLGFNNYLYYDIAYWEKKFPEIGLGAKAAALKDIMSRHGFDFPLIITEMSARSTVPPPYGITRAQQARYLTELYAQLVYYRIGLGMWWTWADSKDSDCEQCYLYKFGVVDAKFVPKPAYLAYETVITQLRDFEPTDAIIKKKSVNLGFKRGSVRKRVVYVRTNPYAPDPASVTMKFHAQRIRVTDQFGSSFFVNDNGTGVIKLPVYGDPVYVEINP